MAKERFNRSTSEKTYLNDVYLLQFASHVPTNDFGSRQRYL